MKLYDLPPSPNARRVRIFIAEKGLDIPTEPVNMMTGENKTEGYLAKNSLGKMPVLELDDGSCISESASICRYLEETHPNPPLMGTDALDRSQVDMWHRRMEFELLNPMITIFVHTGDMWKGRVTQIPELAEVTMANMQASMEWLDQELEGKEVDRGLRASNIFTLLTKELHDGQATSSGHMVDILLGLASDAPSRTLEMQGLRGQSGSSAL